MGLASLFSAFRRKETDLINYAHTVASGAVSAFDDAVHDLKHANEVLADVKDTAVLAIEEARETYDAAVDAAREVYNATHRAAADRHDSAHIAQSKNASVISKIEALVS